MITFEEALASWQVEEQVAFSGWDFSYLEGRWQTQATPWDYGQLVKTHVRSTDKLLDMGTGGGEFLLSLGHPYEQTAATEGWRLNYELLQERLVPLGVELQFVGEDDRLAYATDAFDIVINRHESFDVKEVRRVLKNGGLFITQQVGTGNNQPLIARLRPNLANPYPEVNLTDMKQLLEGEGFEVSMAEEVSLPLSFLDVGALVYYAKVIPWEFPDFSVAADFEVLWDLEKECQAKGKFGSCEERFILIAKNVK